MDNAETKYFDSLGNDFEKFMDDYDVNRRMYLIFSHLLGQYDWKEKTVLEVGCGTGRFSSEIYRRLADLTILDIGERLVRSVSQRLQCKGVVGDACNLPFEDNSFDCVISSECIEHTLNPQNAIRQMCRVCRRGGVVCLTTPNKLWYPVLWLSVKTGIRKFRGIENWLFPYQAARIMKGSGMTQIRMSGCHVWPFQLKRTRPVLRQIDRHWADYLYPVMINFGISGIKEGL